MEVTYPQEFTQLSLVLRYRIPQNCFNSSTVCLYSFIRNNVAEKLNFRVTELAFCCVNCKTRTSKFVKNEINVMQMFCKSRRINKSSTYITKLLFRPQSPKTFSIALMNAARLFLKPYGTVVNWYTLLSNWNAVHCLENCSSGICRKALLKSRLVIYLAP